MLSSVLFLIGCENSELVNCQEENQAMLSNVSLLQQDLNAAKAAVEKKDKTIEDLQSENVQMQTKAMESIKTMMEKQAVKDQELKDKLAVATKQNTELKNQLEQTKAQLDQITVQLKQAQAEREKTLQETPAQAPVAE